MALRTKNAKAKAKTVLNPRQAAFVREYIAAGCKSATRAAVRAGYGAGAAVTASRLLRNPKVAAEIEKVQGRLLDREEITAGRVMRELADVAFCSPMDAVDDEGNLLPLRQMPKGVRHAVELVFKDGELSRLRVPDKLSALKMLADYLGLPKQPPSMSSAPPAEESGVSSEKAPQLADLEPEGEEAPPEER
jgi:phage terminase small subunit